MFKAAVIGVSAGGLNALKMILPALPEDFAIPLCIVQHRGVQSDPFLCDYLNGICALTVKEVEDKERLTPGHAYVAPAGYHVLLEADSTFSLSVDDRVNYCCPAIDVLFESAAEAFGEALIGIVLTGANHDGANGLKAISDAGGTTIIQNPATAQAELMPRAALKAVKADYLLELSDIAPLLIRLSQSRKEPYYGTAANT